MAALKGSEQIVERLIDHGADVNVRNEFLGDTPLEVAATLGHVEVVRRLLAAGADVTIGTECGTPLHMAAYSGRADVAALLLDHGADPNAHTPDGTTPLHAAAEYCPMCPDSFGKTDVTKLLLNRGAEINATTTDGHTPLDLALQVKDTAVVQVLREHGGVEGKPLPPCKPCQRQAKSSPNGR